MQLFAEILSSVLIVSGAIFMLIASIGLLRFPDFYLRNSASTKAIVLGLVLILAGIVVHYNNVEVLIKVTAIVYFIYLITPLSAHIIARAACKNKIPFWKNTILKELKEYYRQSKDTDETS